MRSCNESAQRSPDSDAMNPRLLNLLTALSMLLCVGLIASWIESAIAIGRFRDRLGGNVIIHDTYATVAVAGVQFPLPVAIGVTAILPVWWATWFAARRWASRRRRIVGHCRSC